MKEELLNNLKQTKGFTLSKEYLEYTFMSKFNSNISVSLRLKNYILKDVLEVELVQDNKVIKTWNSNKLNYVIEEKPLRRQKVLDLGIEAYNEIVG